MKIYEFCLLEPDGRTIAVYALNCLNDERAKESIFSAANVPYARCEIWQCMTKIAEGCRFICGGLFATPPDSRALRRLEIFENDGHGVYRDEPERAKKLLREFFAG